MPFPGSAVKRPFIVCPGCGSFAVCMMTCPGTHFPEMDKYCKIFKCPVFSGKKWVFISGLEFTYHARWDGAKEMLVLPSGREDTQQNFPGTDIQTTNHWTWPSSITIKQSKNKRKRGFSEPILLHFFLGTDGTCGWWIFLSCLFRRRASGASGRAACTPGGGTGLPGQGPTGRTRSTWRSTCWRTWEGNPEKNIFEI